MPSCCNKSEKNGEDEDNDCINWLYDILTILISIADIVTDFIVLIDFYIKGRMTFFVASLIILIIAQMAYSIAFMIRFNVTENKTFCCSMILFILLLPFGTIYSFLIYFTDNPDSCFTKFFHKITGLDVNNSIQHGSLYGGQSRMMRWIIRKLSKHIGFIIEAGIEALPQSLLQIIAIVYFKEANYVSIASIFLSMFSVMTKSLVFSQGIDIKTYIWTWLCIVVDFFGVFFTLSWVFYTNDTLLQPVFWGYFSIIGQLWCFKLFVSIVPLIILGLLYWFLGYVWYLLYSLWFDSSEELHAKFGFTFLVVVCGTFAVLVGAGVAFICLEIFCFAFFAFTLFLFLTLRWREYTEKNVSDTINGMISFISAAGICNCNGDRKLRLLAVNNYAYHNINSLRYHSGLSKEILDLITKTEETSGVNGLRQISYRDIRNANKRQSARIAKVFRAAWDVFKEITPGYSEYKNCCKCDRNTRSHEDCAIILIYWLVIILFPICFMSKVFQIFFPYIIVGYLLWNKHLFDVDLFQLSMLFTYIGLQFILFVLGLMVMRIQWWLWHIQSGRLDITLNPSKEASTLLEPAREWYMKRSWYPLIQRLVLQKYGNDIGKLIMHYYDAINLSVEV